MRLRQTGNTPNASTGVRGCGLICLTAYASALVACVVCAQEAPPVSPSSDEILQGIEKSVRAQFEACNEENMDKLLAVVSQDVPSRQMLMTAVDSAWSVDDAFMVLKSVEVLHDSDAPGAEFEYPYSTVRITQTVLELRVNDDRTPVFLRKCRKGDRKPEEIASQLGILRGVETSSAEVLYKHEDGVWKLVNGLTAPVLTEAGSEAERSDAVGVPAFWRVRVSGSVFK